MAEEATNVDVFSKRRSRTAILSLVLAFALVLALTFIGEAFTPGAADRQPGHNSWSYEARGFRALYEVLEALGYRVERHRRTYRALPPAAESVLLSLDPRSLQAILREQARPERESSATLLREWVRAGGRLIITRPGSSMFSYGGFEITLPPDDGDDVGGDEGDDGDEDDGDEDDGDEDDGDADGDVQGGGLGGTARGTADETAEDDETLSLSARDRARVLEELLGEVPDVGSLPLGDLVRTRRPLEELVAEIPDLTPGQARALAAYLSIPGGTNGGDRADAAAIELFDRIPDDAIPLVTYGEGALALEYGLGNGRIICFSTAFPFANGALKWTPSAEVVAQLVAYASEGGRRGVYFDELTHGFYEESGLLLWARETALFYPLATILIGIVLGGWYGAVRFGPPRPERGSARRAREEFVLSLGDLYRRGGHYGHALALVVEAYETRLAQLLGSSGGAIGLDDDGAPARTRFAYRVPTTEREFLKVAASLHEEYLALAATIRGKDAPRAVPESKPLERDDPSR